MLNCVAALSLREAAQHSIPPPSPLPLLPLSPETYPKIPKNIKKINLRNIQKSARFSFRVVWFVHAPVTHPTFQPPLMVSIVFIYLNICLFVFLLRSSWPIDHVAQISFPCAHSIHQKYSLLIFVFLSFLLNVRKC